MWSSSHLVLALAGGFLLPTFYLIIALSLRASSKSIPLGATVLFAIFYLSFLRRVVLPIWRSPLRVLPSAPDDSILLGHAASILGEGRIERFLDWMTSTENAGMLRVSGLFHWTNGVLVTRPEIAWEILTTKAHRFQKPKQIIKWLTLLAGPTGLFTIEGKAHTVQRKTLQRVFTNTAIRNLTPFLWRKCADLADEIARRMDKTAQDEIVLDIQPLSAGATLDITALLLFGKDMNCLRDEEEPMQTVWGFLTNPKNTQGRLTSYFIMQTLLPTYVAYCLAPRFAYKFSKSVKELRQYCLEIVHERREESQKQSKIDILSLMLREEKAFVNDDEIVDQLVTFLAAGHDTTTGAFLWAMWILSDEPEVQQKIRDEFREKLGHNLQPNEVEMGAEKLDTLEYLTAVATEVIRLYPTVPVTPRVAQQDTEIGGVIMPKGTRMYMSSWALQRMPDVWGHDASTFRPERWLNDANGGAKAPHAFVAFISGPRSCIGQYLARVELRSMIVAVLNKFEVSRPVEDMNIGMTGIISNQPNRELRLRFNKIQS